MPWVCGVDLGGRRAHLCFLDPGNQRKPYFVYGEYPKATAPVDAARAASGWVRYLFSQPIFHDNCPVVWLEEPRGASQRAVHQLSVMGGAIAAALPQGVSVEFVPAGECRKLVGLPGNSPKSEVVRFVTLATDLDFVVDHDSADAYVVARAILAHGERGDIAEEVGVRGRVA